MTIIDASIQVIKYILGPHDHYVCIDSQISLNVGLFFSNCQLSFGISNAQKLLDLKKLLVLEETSGSSIIHKSY